MGLHQNVKKLTGSVVTKVGFALALLIAGLISPWWITLLIALLLLVSNALLIEVIWVGMILDLLLGSTKKAGVQNIFFTLCFVLIAILSVIIKRQLNRPSI